MKKTAIAILLLILGKVTALAGFDVGMPSAATPYDRYMTPVRTVLSTAGSQDLTMDEVKKLMIQGRNFRYRMTNPYVAAMPAQTAKNRAGDCKDKALWLCNQLGSDDVRFVIGKTEAGIRINHAWVMWRNEGKWWLLDCTLRRAPIPAEKIPANQYIPLYSFSRNGTYRHAATQANVAKVASRKNSPVASNGRN
jgi:hypothetical protein